MNISLIPILYVLAHPRSAQSGGTQFHVELSDANPDTNRRLTEVSLATAAVLLLPRALHQHRGEGRQACLQQLGPSTCDVISQ